MKYENLQKLFARIPDAKEIKAALNNSYTVPEIERSIAGIDKAMGVVLKNNNFPDWKYKGEKSGVKVPTQALEYGMHRGTPIELGIILWIALHQKNKTKYVVNIKQSSMAKHFKVSRKTVNKSLARLSNANVIIQLYTPREEINKTGMRYCFIGSPYEKELPKYDPKYDGMTDQKVTLH